MSTLIDSSFSGVKPSAATMTGEGEMSPDLSPECCARAKALGLPVPLEGVRLALGAATFEGSCLGVVTSVSVDIPVYPFNPSNGAKTIAEGGEKNVVNYSGMVNYPDIRSARLAVSNIAKNMFKMLDNVSAIGFLCILKVGDSGKFVVRASSVSDWQSVAPKTTEAPKTAEKAS